MMRDTLQLSVRRATLATGVMTMTVLASACGGGSTQTAAPSPDVWALVDGRQILRADVDKAYRGMVAGAAATPSVEEMVNLKLNILDEMITQDLLLAKAREGGVEATDVEIDNALAEQKRSMSEADFQSQLSARGLTLEDIRLTLRREISGRKLIEREVAAKVAITEEDIAAFYNQNRAQFNFTEPHYRLAQILVTPQRDPNVQNRLGDDAATADEARRKADMLTERLRSGGDFSALAMDYSEDPQSVAQGGDLGLVPESSLASLPPALSTAVRSMQPGTASTLSVGPNYIVLMVIAREPAGVRELGTATVRDGIRDLLQNRRQQLLQQAYLTHLRESASVDNYLASQVVETQGRVPGQTVAVAEPPALPAAPAAAPAPAAAQ
jgi:peptidyl-prolyl cis-trans isomerase SurA